MFLRFFVFLFAFKIALCGITDAYGKGIAHTERMRSTGKVANVILRTWSGKRSDFFSVLIMVLMASCRIDVSLLERYARYTNYDQYPSNTFSGNKGLYF